MVASPHHTPGTTYLPRSVDLLECLSGKVYQDKITPLKPSPNPPLHPLPTASLWFSLIFPLSFQTLLLSFQSDRQAHIHICGKQMCFLFFLPWWRRDGNVIDECAHVCVYVCVCSCLCTAHMTPSPSGWNWTFWPYPSFRMPALIAIVLLLILFIPYAWCSDTCGAEETVFDDMLSCMT